MNPAPPVTSARMISCRGRSRVPVELADGRDDQLTLIVTELRIVRQRQRAPGLTLGRRKIATAVAERAGRRLQMDRDWIVHLRFDTSLQQVALQLVATIA